ncbi:MAG: hypothetical protein JSU68_10180 [Phycisphaerales bacterium]|nr:MAG: hypothetical protein JSU68_10180 [Phycisphaerales bacterium]
MRNLKVTDFGGYVEAVARRREFEQESKVINRDRKSKETIFEENLQLEVEGYTYHPNLMEFSAAGLFGLLQHDFKEDVTGTEGVSGSESGTVVEFDLTGYFLKEKPYPGMAYARREQALEPRTFRPSVEVTNESYGLQWEYLSEKVPTRVLLSHVDVHLDPLETQEEEGRQKNTLFRLETGYNFNDYNALSFIYSHEDVSEEPDDLDYDTDEVTLAHRWEFGEDRLHRLDSELNFQNTDGSFDSERLRWRERLRLQHTDNLRSSYFFEALDRTRGSLSGGARLEERSYFFTASVEHRLYDSLVSQLGGHFQTQDFKPGTQVDRVGVNASLDYRKRNPWGVLKANYSIDFEMEERSGGPTEAEVRDESHTFIDPDPITLSNPDVVVGSIIITALDRFTVYRLGRDYRLRTIGDRVEIERVPTGFIADGETVLVDYIFRIGGDLTRDTFRQEFSLRQDFDFGLSPYYRLRWQDQEITQELDDGVTPEDITAHIVGADFRWRSFFIGAEYEDHDSTLNPYEAFRLNASYTHRFETGASGSLRALWTDYTYRLPQTREARFLTLEGRYRHPITENLLVEGAVLYRNGEDTLSGDEEGVDVDLSLEWFIRQTEFRITYEYGRFDDDFARNDSSALYVQLRRRF